MHIFVDESGSFIGFHPGSISAVGALTIPDCKLAFLKRKYEKLRQRLPKYKGEVKGRLLNEKQVAEIVALLAANECVFEVTVVDFGIQTPDGVAAFKEKNLTAMYELLPKFSKEWRPKVDALLRELAATSPNLYIQANAHFDLLRKIICNVPLYFVQRRPEELGSFMWIIDGKEPAKITAWEKWWSEYAVGALAAMSASYPAPSLRGANYSYYDRKYGTLDENGQQSTDLTLLLKDLNFSSEPEMGLELVDILVNAVRRAITGNLGIEGWRQIPRIIIHRKEPYITILRLDGTGESRTASPGNAPFNPTYSAVIDHFRQNGKPMLTPDGLRLGKRINAHLSELERQHKTLEDDLAEALVHRSTDDLKIAELKRRKLQLKDEIEWLRYDHSLSQRTRFH